ncbi:hypothetical protein RN001_013260 [Aquatica leii]|uniref:Uncharacterized protein n=1 Tax=Aquatica leii TaxID=1421715 RepID=A0AAN7SNN5_9COLE|nr:hypothetical protein RN001_013260 [Aquatica leii]
MIFQLTSVLLLSACLNQVTSSEVTDWKMEKADLICAAKFNVLKEQFYSMFDDNLKLINPDDELVKKFTRCWMLENGIIDGAGNLNLGIYKIWYTTYGYEYLGKDNVEKYKIEDREISFDKAVVDCQTQMGVTLNIKDKEPHFYNCIISTISAL